MDTKSLEIDHLHLFQVTVWMYFLCKKDSLICKYKEKGNRVTGADHSKNSDGACKCLAYQRTWLTQLLHQACIASRQ